MKNDRQSSHESGLLTKDELANAESIEVEKFETGSQIRGLESGKLGGYVSLKSISIAGSVDFTGEDCFDLDDDCLLSSRRGMFLLSQSLNCGRFCRGIVWMNRFKPRFDSGFDQTDDVLVKLKDHLARYCGGEIRSENCRRD
jgi:hypothetical protein